MKELLNGGTIVVRSNKRIAGDLCWHARAIRQAHGSHAGTGLHQQHIGMSMITAAKLENFVAASIGTCQPQGTHSRLSAGVDKAHHFNRWNALNDQLSQFVFGLRGRTKAKTPLARLYHRMHHARMAMAENHGSPGLHIVQIAVAIDIIEIGAVSRCNEDGAAAHSAKSPYRTINATRQTFLRLLKKSLRAKEMKLAFYRSLIMHELGSYCFQYLIQGLSNTGEHRCVAQCVGTGLGLAQGLYKVKKVTDVVGLKGHYKFLI